MERGRSNRNDTVDALLHYLSLKCGACFRNLVFPMNLVAMSASNDSQFH